MRWILICVAISCCEAVLWYPGIYDSETLTPEERFVEAHNDFSTHLYRSLSSMEGNFFFCAICLSSSLSLLLEASRGNTSEELNTTLGYLHNNLDKYTVRSYYSDVNSRLLLDKAQTSANAIFIKNRLGLNSSYQSVSLPVYNTDIRDGAFWGINHNAAWARQNFKFTRVMLEGTGSVSNAAILKNALMFDMDFSNVFGDASMKIGVFHNHGDVDRNVTVPVLHKKYSEHRIATSDDFRALELQYDPQSTIRVWFLLPQRMEGLSDVEDSLSSSTFKQITASFAEMQLNITLPVAEIEFRQDISENIAAKLMFALWTGAAHGKNRRILN